MFLDLARSRHGAARVVVHLPQDTVGDRENGNDHPSERWSRFTGKMLRQILATVDCLVQLLKRGLRVAREIPAVILSIHLVGLLADHFAGLVDGAMVKNGDGSSLGRP